MTGVSTATVTRHHLTATTPTCLVALLGLLTACCSPGKSTQSWNFNSTLFIPPPSPSPLCLRLLFPPNRIANRIASSFATRDNSPSTLSLVLLSLSLSRSIGRALYFCVDFLLFPLVVFLFASCLLFFRSLFFFSNSRAPPSTDVFESNRIGIRRTRPRKIHQLIATTWVCRKFIVIIATTLIYIFVFQRLHLGRFSLPFATDRHGPQSDASSQPRLASDLPANQPINQPSQRASWPLSTSTTTYHRYQPRIHRASSAS